MTSRHLAALVLTLGWLGCGGGSPTAPPPPAPTPTPAPMPAPITLSSIQASIFTPTCALPACHSGALPQAGLSLAAGTSFGRLVGVASTQQGGLNRVRPGDPGASYLVRKLENGPSITGDRMPLNSGALSTADIKRIRDWITAGAANN